MASKVMASTALFLCFNLLFLAISVSSHDDDHQWNNPDDSSNGVIDISLGLLNGKGLGNFHHLPHDDSKYPSTNSKKPVVTLPVAATGAHNHQGKSTCNPLNLGVCANLLNGAVSVELGDVPTRPCCSLIQGLADLEAAVCLCTAIRAKVLGIIDLNATISLRVLFNNCGRRIPYDYRCTL